jgi:hypothetical protein
MASVGRGSEAVLETPPPRPKAAPLSTQASNAEEKPLLLRLKVRGRLGEACVGEEGRERDSPDVCWMGLKGVSSGVDVFMRPAAVLSCSMDGLSRSRGTAGAWMGEAGGMGVVAVVATVRASVVEAGTTAGMVAVVLGRGEGA